VRALHGRTNSQHDSNCIGNTLLVDWLSACRMDHIMAASYESPDLLSRRRWLVLAVGFLVMSVGFALRNSFSVFYPVVVADFGWTRGGGAVMFSLSILVYGLLSPAVGGLVDRFKPQIVVATGVVLLAGCVALCSLATEQWQFYLLYGVGGACGVAMMGIVPLAATITPWFSRHRAMAFAVLAAGFGVSLVSASLVQFLISLYGWRRALLCAGLSAIVIVVPVVLAFLRRPPSLLMHREVPEAAREAEMSGELPCTAVHGGAGWHAREWTVRRALRTPQFWMLWVAGFCQLGLAEKVAIAHQVYFFRDAGYSPAAAASVYAVFGAMFVAGTLASSLSDRMGRERLYVPACALALVGVGLLFVIPGSSVSWLPYVFAVCFGIGMGIMPPVLFASVADLFHGKSYGGIQGTVALGFSLGGAIGPWVAGHMHDVLGSYDSTLVMLVGALLASGLLVILAAPGRHSSVC